MQLLMSFRKFYKPINIRSYGFYTALHCGYRITLPLQTLTLPPNSTKSLMRKTRSTSRVATC